MMMMLFQKMGQMMRTKLGFALLAIWVTLEALGVFLDFLGRVQMLIELLPSALRFLAHPAFKSVLLLGSIALLIWAYVHRREETKRRPKMTCTLYVMTGALVGALTGLGVFIWRESPPPIATSSHDDKLQEPPVEPPKPAPKETAADRGVPEPKQAVSSAAPKQVPAPSSVSAPGGIAIGGDNLGTATVVNLGAPPSPPLELQWTIADVVPPVKNEFRFQKEITVTPNIDYSPVSVGVWCDSEIGAISGSFRSGGMFSNVHEGTVQGDNKIGYVYFEGNAARTKKPLIINVFSNQPLSVLAVRPIKLAGLSD